MDIHPIAKQIWEAKTKNIKLWKPSGLRASECGHPCERYLYYTVVEWDKRAPHDTDLQMIFELGSVIEEKALSDLREAGYTVVETQRPFEWKYINLVGRIDFKIKLNGNLVPVEVKSMSPHIWSSIDSVKDMITAKQPWVRGYPAQILMYLVMTENEKGLFDLFNKITGKSKFIDVNLFEHLEHASYIIDKLQRVNEAITEKRIPGRMIFAEDYCTPCAFFALCQPEIDFGVTGDILHDEELMEALITRDTLKDLAKKYEEVDKYVKEKVRGLTKVICGDFLITGTEITRHEKPREARTSTFWRSTIQRFKGGSRDTDQS